MAIGKALGPDKIVIFCESLARYWGILLWYDCKVHQSWKIPKRSHTRANNPMYKFEEKSDLGNWHPISLLNMAYKIHVKALLQLRMQIILMELIDGDQTTFLPLGYKLDNMLLAHEKIDWARCIRQKIIYLKLDIAKTYDKVSWDFFFLAMRRMGIANEFINMIKLLF